MGMLMERLFWHRVVQAVRRAAGPCQTGYQHRCEYNALIFHELAASRLACNVGMVALMGDLVGAFPKTWRSLVIVLAAVAAGVQGTELVLLREFLRFTAVEISYSGSSVVETSGGLPEGGMLGPLCYPLVPAMLSKLLQDNDCGIGVDVASSTLYSSCGKDILSAGDASFLERVNNTATSKVPILLVADDQIIPEVSIERLQRAASLASGWALHTGQQYHVSTPEKTSILLIGHDSMLAKYTSAPVCLGGAQVPGTLVKKWVGILWDNQLSFDPFLHDRVRLAKFIFKSLAGLAADRLVPLSEVRSAMVCKLESAIFFGSMFLFMSSGAGKVMDELQLSFERVLLGAPSWLPDVQVRAAGGWLMAWSDRLLYDALSFRAELWCCEASMLVREVWSAAQSYPGNTFAFKTRKCLQDLELPEIYEHAGWYQYMRTGRSPLHDYKMFLKSRLEDRSVQSWKAKLVVSRSCPTYLLCQHYPCSASGRMLDADWLEYTWAADSWERLRLSLGVASKVLVGPCVLCGSRAYGHAHILASCNFCTILRTAFLAKLDDDLAERLRSAPEGDWPSVLYNPHMELSRLKVIVKFCDWVMLEILKYLLGSCIPCR